MKAATLSADERRAKGFLARLVEAVNKGEAASVNSVLHHALGGRRREREEMVVLIEKMVEADPALRLVAPTVSSLLRTSIASEEVRNALAGTPTLVTDLEDERLTSDDVLRIARIRGEAEASILRQPMFESSVLARALGSSSSNPREFARVARARGDVIGLPRPKGHVFPVFQVDRARGEVWPIVVEINHLLGANEDPWGVASWWFTEDPILETEPYRLVSDPRRAEDLRRAARAALAAVE